MKTIMLTLATLALLSGSAMAGKEHCVTRVLTTNYNSGMEGQVSTVCSGIRGGQDNAGNAGNDTCESKRS